MAAFTAPSTAPLISDSITVHTKHAWLRERYSSVGRETRCSTVATGAAGARDPTRGTGPALCGRDASSAGSTEVTRRTATARRQPSKSPLATGSRAHGADEPARPTAYRALAVRISRKKRACQPPRGGQRGTAPPRGGCTRRQPAMVRGASPARSLSAVGRRLRGEMLRGRTAERAWRGCRLGECGRVGSELRG